MGFSGVRQAITHPKSVSWGGGGHLCKAKRAATNN